MEVRTIPLRHELKYYIHPSESQYLRGIFDKVLRRDPNGDENNEYHVRSLYFDTIDDSALEEKIAGYPSRDKYRIRIYKFSDRQIRLERKSKYDNLISKLSVDIPRSLAEQLMACDPSGLEFMRHPLLRDTFTLMKTRLLRPVVIVDYLREAYVHDAEEVRVTLDKRLRTGLFSTDLFNPHIPTYPVFDDEMDILEIKYNTFLPTYIQSLLSSLTATKSAISKYVWCRRYENKEY